MKLEKQYYNSMEFLSSEFLYSALLCQKCFQYSLIQVAWDGAPTELHRQHNKDTGRPHSNHHLRKRILKVCVTGEVEVEKEEVGFSHFHSRLADVFLRERESGAVQARSFHYHSEKALHETLPGKQGKAVFIIFLPYHCQNMLYFTFPRSFTFCTSQMFWFPYSLLFNFIFGILYLSQSICRKKYSQKFRILV